MSGVTEQDRLARAALSVLADPGDEVLGSLLRTCGPAEVLAAIAAGERAAALPVPAAGRAALTRALAKWRLRLPEVPTAGWLAAWQDAGNRLICPGDPEWPTQLDDLGDARPFVLWLRGAADLRFACLRSVSIVGSRAATAYGNRISTEFAADLSSQGWTVISGGAYGIDACAHRGALTVAGSTVAVLGCGLAFGIRAVTLTCSP